MCARCPVALEVSGEVLEVSAMRKIGQLQGQRARRPYTHVGFTRAEPQQEMHIARSNVIK